jgi:hypothetical protein
MNLSSIVQALRLVKKAEAEERKHREFAALNALPLNYGIIQDLVNSASYGVVIDFTLTDGTRIQITRQDAFDRSKVDAALAREMVGGL